MDAPSTLEDAPGAAVAALMDHGRDLIWLVFPFAFITTTLTFFADDVLDSPQLLVSAPTSPASLLFVGFHIAILATHAYFWCAGFHTLHPKEEDGPSDPFEAGLERFLPVIGYLSLLLLMASCGAIILAFLQLLGITALLPSLLVSAANAVAGVIALAVFFLFAPALVPISLGHASILDSMVFSAVSALRQPGLVIGMGLFAVLPFITLVALATLISLAFDLQALNDFSYILSGLLFALLWPHFLAVLYRLYTAQLHHRPQP